MWERARQAVPTGRARVPEPIRSEAVRPEADWSETNRRDPARPVVLPASDTIADASMLEALHDVRPSPEADGTPDNAVLPEIALDLTHLPATPLGPTVPVPQMQPRAMFPFGWSRGDMRRGALLGFTLLAGLVFLWRVQAILPPFLIAFGLAALLDPTLRYNERRGRPRVYTILMLYMLALSLLAITVFWVIPEIVRQVEDISANLSHYYASLQTTLNDMMRHNANLLNFAGIGSARWAICSTPKAGRCRPVSGPCWAA